MYFLEMVISKLDETWWWTLHKPVSPIKGDFGLLFLFPILSVFRFVGGCDTHCM
jgi:hypothetical protein